MHRSSETFALDLTADGVTFVTLVTVRDFRGDQPVGQFICSDTIGHMAAGQQKGDRTTAYVAQCVDFYRPPAARAADRLLMFPLFRPRRSGALSRQTSRSAPLPVGPRQRPAHGSSRAKLLWPPSARL